MGIAAVLDKAGPALASGIILGILGAAATSALAWRDLLSTSTVRFGSIDAEIQRLRADLDAFRAPGGRFTKHDGDRLQAELFKLDERIRAQEMRPPRLNEALEQHERECQHIHDMVISHEQQIKHIVTEQDRLCSRLQACRQGGQR